jgi:phage FluMu gp28-like protein
MKLNFSRAVTVVWRVRFRVTATVPVVVVDAVEFARDRLDFWPDLRQAEILGRRIRRGLVNCSRQWGKSTVAAAKAVHQAYFYSGSLTLMVAPSARQSGEFLRKAAELLARVGIRVRGDGTNESSILLPNGSRLVALPGNEATIRGFSKVSLLLIDEASRVSDEMYQALRPMLAVGDGDLLMMSTPNGRRGFFWEEWSEGGDGWERWSVPATECARIPASFLAEERRTMGDRGFRQEYMCEFLEMEGALFTEEMIQRAFRDDVKPLEIRRR